MATNLDRFKNDLARLIKTGSNLELAMQYECFPERVREALILLCHKRSFSLTLPQQGHWPRRVSSA
jgi:hypothetical protein